MHSAEYEMNVYVEDLSELYDLKKLEKENGIFDFENKPLRLFQNASLSDLYGHEQEYTTLAIDNGGRLFNIAWDIVNFETEYGADTCN